MASLTEILFLFLLKNQILNNLYSSFLQDILNFTYTLKKPSDGQYGAINSDGSWTGMIGEIQAEKADMGICLFYQFILKYL